MHLDINLHQKTAAAFHRDTLMLLTQRWCWAISLNLRLKVNREGIFLFCWPKMTNVMRTKANVSLIAGKLDYLRDLKSAIEAENGNWSCQAIHQYMTPILPAMCSQIISRAADCSAC